MYTIVDNSPKKDLEKIQDVPSHNFYRVVDLNGFNNPTSLMPGDIVYVGYASFTNMTKRRDWDSRKFSILVEPVNVELIIKGNE